MSGRVEILKTEILSKNWYKLNKVTFRYQLRNGEWIVQEREAYDRGNGAVILLYNRAAGTIVLTRQFRLPTFLNGNSDGMMVEACAGLLDLDNPEDCIRKEATEETGFSLSEVTKVYECYMSPGSVTELLHFFIAEYDGSMKTSCGGGVEGEEDIEVLELRYSEALAMIRDGRIKDAKTIILLQHLKVEGIL